MTCKERKLIAGLRSHLKLDTSANIRLHTNLCLGFSRRKMSELSAKLLFLLQTGRQGVQEVTYNGQMIYSLK